MAGSSKIQPTSDYNKDVTNGAKWVSSVLLLASLSWGSYITIEVMNNKTDIKLIQERQKDLKEYYQRMETTLNKLLDKMDAKK